MNKHTYPFYIIPKVVFDNPNLSPCAKLLFAYFISREKYNMDNNGSPQGAFIQCFLRVLANKIGKSSDSVRKNYIPELIREGLIEKKNIGGAKGDKHSTMCLFSIRWESIESEKSNKNNQNNEEYGKA